jgi:hypothetical protein
LLYAVGLVLDGVLPAGLDVLRMADLEAIGSTDPAFVP